MNFFKKYLFIDYNRNLRIEQQQLYTQKDLLQVQSSSNSSRFVKNNNNFIDNSELRNELYLTNYNDESFRKRKLKSLDPTNFRRFSNQLITNIDNNTDIRNNNIFNNNLLNTNLNYFSKQPSNLLHAREIINKDSFMDERSRRTLDEKDLRRSNLLRINSNFPRGFDNHLNSNNNHNTNFNNYEWRNPRNNFSNLNYNQQLNRNIAFAYGTYKENVPHKTTYFPISNINYNNNYSNNSNYNNSHINDNRCFANKVDFAYKDNYNNRDNFSSNAKCNKYLMHKNAPYLQDSASHIKPRNKFQEKDEW